LNRTEEKLLKKQQKRNRIRNAWVLLMCFVLFITMIYVTDMRTSDLVSKKDGKHALFLNIENQKDVRIDIAGETYKFDIEYITKTISNIVKWSKEAFNSIVSKLGS